MSWSTTTWLKGFGLEQYHNHFIENGYETQKLCANLKNEDLDGMDITNSGHRSVLLNQADLLKCALSSPSSSYDNESHELSTTNGDLVQSVHHNGYGRDQFDGGKSPQKPRSNSTGNVEKLSVITDTDTYTTVFDDVQDTKRNKKRPKIRSPKALPKRFDVKIDPTKNPQRKPHPASEGSEITTLVGIPPQMMTKLQLKIRIKDMLARDNIILSRPKYSAGEGIANEIALIEIAENYAEELGLEGLDVFDAVKHVWRYTNNEKSDYVLPKSNPSTPGTGSSIGTTSFNEVFEQGNYSEPFDSTSSTSNKSNFGKLSPRKISADTVINRAPPSVMATIPDSGSNYAEPFDSIPVTNQPIIVKTSPEKKHRTIQSTPKQNYKASNETLAVERRTSKTLPSSPNLSTRSSSSEGSPCPSHSPRVKKQWSPFNRTGKLEQKQLPQTAVLLPGLDGKKQTSTSAENLTKIGVASGSTKRQSLPSSEFVVAPGLSRSVSSNPALLYQQCLQEEGSKKTNTQSQESINELQSNLHQIPIQKKDNEDNQDFKVTSRVKGLTVTNRAASELELSNVLEVYVDGSDKPVKFQRYQELAVTKEEKKKSLLRRLFHKRKSKDKKNRSIDEEETSVSSDMKDDKNGLTSSTSLPDITAAATIHSEYAEVFDVDSDSTPTTPPKLPSRNRPHSAKTPRRNIPQEQSSFVTPTSHHKLMISSDPMRSNEVIISTPLSNKDDIIEISVPDYEEPFKQVVSSTEPKQSSIIETSPIAGNRYDDPWKPIIRPKPKSIKNRVSSSDSRGTSEEPDSNPSPNKKQKPPLAPKPQLILSDHSGSARSSRSSLSPNHEVLLSPDHNVSPSKSQPPPKPARNRSRDTSKSPSPEPYIAANTIDHLIHDSSVETKSNEHSFSIPEQKNSPSHATNSPPTDSEKDQKNKTSTQKPPKPSRLPTDTKGSRPASTSSSSPQQAALEEKLSQEVIDLTVPPYSSERGEYGIPSALVSRYSEELGNIEDEVAKMLDKIRRSSLLRARRGHIPLKKDWKSYSYVNTSSIEEFLISIGFSQYQTKLAEKGFDSVTKLKELKWDSLLLPESHKSRLKDFINKL